MASRIQGITVEIGGDTMKLTTALKSVNLWSKFGLSMEQFRTDIKAAMEGSTAGDSLTAIMGKAKATAGQMASYLKKKNPSVAQSVLDMIPLYLSEGEAEGVRGDIAFAQSCLETGNFTFSGSAATLSQNNICGLGVTQKENPQGKGWAAGEKYGEKILFILKAIMDEGQVQFMESLTPFRALHGACVNPRPEHPQRPRH